MPPSGRKTTSRIRCRCAAGDEHPAGHPPDKRSRVHTDDGRPITDSVIAGLKLKLDKQLPGMAPWTFHDLRRSTASHMSALGIPLPVIERLLNHSFSGLSGVAKVYLRHDFLNERRRAVELWAAKIEALLAGTDEASNVVAIRAGG